MLDDNLTGIKRIASIARDLQMFSRADRDDLQPVDVNEIVDVACNLAYNDIRHRARLVKELGRIPSTLAEPGKLAQALTNLLANAAQAIDVGAADEHEVRVSTRLVDGEVRIVVSDTGRGIPGELHGQIFEPFFTTKPSEGGTGLGLSLCAEIVRKHGGDIQVRSVPDHGTRFEIKLPFRPAEQIPVVPTLYPQADALPRARILIVDDDVAVLRAQRRLLSGDHDVSTAGSGAEALARMAEEGPFDVILCDVMMPTMDGPMFYEAVRLQDPVVADTILFCSGGVFTERAKAFIAAVPNSFLAKPISREALQRALRKVLRRNQGALKVIA
jgi:CheY-like chemotaxis protein/two-component sensor histidine kinase